MRSSSLKKIEKICIPGTFSGIHYISFTVLIITLLLSTNIVLAAEGISVPLKKTPVITGKTGAASDFAKTYTPKEQAQKAGEVTSKGITKDEQNLEKKQTTFVDNVFGMFRALFLVLAIIGGLSGAVLFYRWLKNKSILVKAQQQITQAPLESREPETVSEAVASFVKHRIKK